MAPGYDSMMDVLAAANVSAELLLNSLSLQPVWGGPRNEYSNTINTLILIILQYH